MKPLKLTIKGLNSFAEAQTIDFEELSSKGIFGIFGPTGSGKSTILDGITLALYVKLQWAVLLIYFFLYRNILILRVLLTLNNC